MTRTASIPASPRPPQPPDRLTAAKRVRARLVDLAPGLGLAGAGVAVSSAAAFLLPGMSALLIAIVLGVLLRNTVSLPSRVEAGLSFAAKPLLRLGVVLLGLQLVVGDILDLGVGVIAVVVAIVAIGITSTLLIGRVLGVSATQRLLIACGFSICGAAAVAAVDGVVEAEEEEVVTAVALVVVFGTLMIPLIPLAASVLGLDAQQAGIWAGGSIHEVAQVVAVGGALGGAGLAVAVVVKLARVLMLAPVLAIVSVQRRRALAAGGTAGANAGERPPIVPLFVVGFIAMVVVRSLGWVPEAVVAGAGVAQTMLLAAAMFALGTGVRFTMLRRVGVRPFALAGASTLVVAGVALAGVVAVA